MYTRILALKQCQIPDKHQKRQKMMFTQILTSKKFFPPNFFRPLFDFLIINYYIWCCNYDTMENVVYYFCVLELSAAMYMIYHFFFDKSVRKKHRKNDPT